MTSLLETIKGLNWKYILMWVSGAILIGFTIHPIAGIGAFLFGMFYVIVDFR